MALSYYELFMRGSENHSVRIEKDSIAIAPVDFADKHEALKRFQSVAKMAVEHEGEGYEIRIRVYHRSLATFLMLKPML
jgi:hypothetical protein